MRLSLIVIAALMLVTGCGTPYYDGDENSPFNVAPVGTHVVLHQEVSFAPDQLGVFIQNGRLIPFPQVNTFNPYCKLELYKKSATEQKIAPDEFSVIKPVQLVPTEVSTGSPFRRVATDPGSAGGLKLTYFTTRMFLRSEKQPNVYVMECEHRGSMDGNARITIAEMRQTLAPIMTLKVSAPPAR